MTEVRVMRLPGFDASVPLPDYASRGAAGADIRANFEDRGEIELSPGARALVPTGFAVALPEGFEMQIRPRSGLALKHGVTLVNSPGTVDADYRGAVGVIIVNHGHEAVTVSHGDRIAQAVIAPVIQTTFVEVEALEETARGAGGFGSTGRG